jgi:hypothetical protein
VDGGHVGVRHRYPARKDNRGEPASTNS